MPQSISSPAAAGLLASLSVAVMLSASAMAQGSRPDSQAGPRTDELVTKGTAQKAALRLTDAQKQQILQALLARNTLDKAPEGFVPEPGAKVPSQQKLPLHPLPADVVQKVPALKEYEYAKLEHAVLIVDPMTQQVVDVIPQ